MVEDELKRASLLELFIHENKALPSTPEGVRFFWQLFITDRIAQSGIGLSVPEVPLPNITDSELAESQEQGLGLVFDPGFDYPILEKLFPKKLPTHHLITACRYDTQPNEPGYYNIETGNESPNRNMSGTEFMESLKFKGRMGLSLKRYIWGSQANRLINGRFFDDRMWSRIPGFRDGDGEFFSVSTGETGVLELYGRLRSDSKSPMLGNRSEKLIMSVSQS